MKKRYLLTKIHLMLFLAGCSISCTGQQTLSLETIEGDLRIRKTHNTHPADNVHCGLQDKDGNLWFGTTGEGVYRFDQLTGTFIHFTEKDGLSDTAVWCMLQDRSGIIWFGTDKGPCRYDGNTFIPAADTNLHHPIFSLFEDKSGSLWFGTVNNGVYCTTTERGSYFFTNDLLINRSDLKLNNVQAMLEDRSGNLWFASWSREGVCRYDFSAESAGRSSLVDFAGKPGITDNMMHALLEDKAGRIWIGTRDHGVCRYDPATAAFTDFTEKTLLHTSCIYSMLEDKTGKIWLATEKDGVWRYDPLTAEYTSFTTENGLGNNSVFSLVEDTSAPEGEVVIWFGTRNTGLCRYDSATGLITDFSDNNPGK